MDLTQVLQLLGSLVVIGTAVGTVWWKIGVMVDKSRQESSAAISSATELASLARSEIADLRLHTAENYITKAGFRDATEQIMDAISGVKGSVDQMRDRIDRAFDKPLGGR